MSLTISTNKELLKVSFITNFLSNSYWAEGRSIEAMEKLIDNSLNFGIYLDGEQISYARIVTDYQQFAYLMDVFVVDEHRGKGYSKMLMQAILENELLKEVKVWRLATTDAHGLYQQFGFTPLSEPENMMELMR